MTQQNPFLEPVPGNQDIPKFVQEAEAQRAGIDAAEDALLALDHYSAEIARLEDELQMYRDARLATVRRLIEVHEVGAPEVAGRLGISTRRVYKMIETPKTTAEES